MEKVRSKVLALKYRPKNFNELIGQDVMVETITNSIKLNKLPNAYLFTGIRGVGKTTTARIVAKSLNCKNGITNLCNDKMCEHCESGNSGIASAHNTHTELSQTLGVPEKHRHLYRENTWRLAARRLFWRWQ